MKNNSRCARTDKESPCCTRLRPASSADSATICSCTSESKMCSRNAASTPSTRVDSRAITDPVLAVNWLSVCDTACPD